MPRYSQSLPRPAVFRPLPKLQCQNLICIPRAFLNAPRSSTSATTSSISASSGEGFLPIDDLKVPTERIVLASCKVIAVQLCPNPRRRQADPCPDPSRIHLQIVACAAIQYAGRRQGNACLVWAEPIQHALQPLVYMEAALIVATACSAHSWPRRAGLQGSTLLDQSLAHDHPRARPSSGARRASTGRPRSRGAARRIQCASLRPRSQSAAGLLEAAVFWSFRREAPSFSACRRPPAGA